jgi:hypothetical protein
VLNTGGGAGGGGGGGLAQPAPHVLVTLAKGILPVQRRARIRVPAAGDPAMRGVLGRRDRRIDGHLPPGRAWLVHGGADGGVAGRKRRRAQNHGAGRRRIGIAAAQ